VCDDFHPISPISTSHHFLLSFFSLFRLSPLLPPPLFFHTSSILTLCPFIHPSLAHTRSHSLPHSLTHSITQLLNLSLFLAHSFFILFQAIHVVPRPPSTRSNFFFLRHHLSLNKKCGPCFVALFVVIIFTLTGTYINSLRKTNEEYLCICTQFKRQMKKENGLDSISIPWKSHPSTTMTLAISHFCFNCTTKEY
jgi:hypothetical protein